VLVVRGTKKFLSRVGIAAPVHGLSTCALGDWYAKTLFWRPQVALFVNERTRLPVFVPLAPAKSVVDRFPVEFEKVARRIGVDGDALLAEVAAMKEWVLAKTASRSVLGTMNEFGHMADNYRCLHDEVDLIDLAVWLAETPCLVSSPGDVVWPEDAVRALLR
jgi:hypothetical protein